MLLSRMAFDLSTVNTFGPNTIFEKKANHLVTYKMEKHQEMQKELHIVFIYLETRIMMTNTSQPSVYVGVTGKITGPHQGCSLSPYLIEMVLDVMDGVSNNTALGVWCFFLNSDDLALCSTKRACRKEA